MKIAVSIKAQNPDTYLDARFGRCPYFFIFDTLTGSYTTIKNTASNAPGGAGNLAAKLINEQGVTAVISGNYGPHAVTALKNFGIKMYISAEEKIWTVLDKFKHNLLIEAETATVHGKH